MGIIRQFICCMILLFFVHIFSFVHSKEQCFNSVGDPSKIPELSKKNVTFCNTVKNSDALLSRKRRALFFPDGTRLLMTASLVKIVLLGIPLGWNVALEIDVFYNMHKQNEIFTKGKKYFKLHHKQRRDVWDNLEAVLQMYGMEGPTCVFRAICEAQQYLASKDASLVHDVLRTMFSAPEEDGPHDEYTAAHKAEDCKIFHDKCPISLLEILLSYQRT